MANLSHWRNVHHKLLQVKASQMPAGNQPALTLLPWRERGRGDQQSDAALADTPVLSRVPGAGVRHRAAREDCFVSSALGGLSQGVGEGGLWC